MKNLSRILLSVLVCAIPICSSAQKKVQKVNSVQHQIPHLLKQGKTTQLIVDDKPFSYTLDYENNSGNDTWNMEGAIFVQTKI